MLLQEANAEGLQLAFSLGQKLIGSPHIPEGLPQLLREVLRNSSLRSYLEQAACFGKEPRLPLALAASIPLTTLQRASVCLHASRVTKVTPHHLAESLCLLERIMGDKSNPREAMSKPNWPSFVKRWGSGRRVAMRQWSSGRRMSIVQLSRGGRICTGC
jgi:hypothetical protein